jgi:hypothetical protein
MPGCKRFWEGYKRAAGSIDSSVNRALGRFGGLVARYPITIIVISTLCSLACCSGLLFLGSRTESRNDKLWCVPYQVSVCTPSSRCPLACCNVAAFSRLYAKGGATRTPERCCNEWACAASSQGCVDSSRNGPHKLPAALTRARVQWRQSSGSIVMAENNMTFEASESVPAVFPYSSDVTIRFTCVPQRRVPQNSIWVQNEEYLERIDPRLRNTDEFMIMYFQNRDGGNVLYAEAIRDMFAVYEAALNVSIVERGRQYSWKERICKPTATGETALLAFPVVLLLQVLQQQSRCSTSGSNHPVCAQRGVHAGTPRSPSAP